MADVVDGGGAFGIEKCGFGGYVDCGAESGEV